MEDIRTLKLEKRGCDFWKDSKEATLSNVGNYRVGVYNYKIPGKDGRLYIVEFSCFDRYQYRTKSKKSGETLKNPIRELVKECALHIDTQFEEMKPGDKWPSCWRNIDLEKEIYNLNLSFTIEGIETALEYITGHKYKVEI